MAANASKQRQLLPDAARGPLVLEIPIYRSRYQQLSRSRRNSWLDLQFVPHYLRRLCWSFPSPSTTLRAQQGFPANNLSLREEIAGSLHSNQAVSCPADSR